MLVQLTGLRGVAAVIVALFHVGWFAGDQEAHGFLRGELVLAFFQFPGESGVMLFFALSGFLMGFLYYNKAYTEHNVRDYALSRAGRILPLYYVGILAVYVFGQDRSFLLGLMFIPFQMYDHLWTVPVEVHYYVVFVGLWYASQFPRATVGIVSGFVGLYLLSILRVAALVDPWLSAWLPGIFLREVYCCQENPACLMAYLPVFLVGTSMGAGHRTDSKPFGPLLLSVVGVIGTVLFFAPPDHLPRPRIDYSDRVVLLVQSRVYFAVPITYYEDTFCSPLKWVGIVSILMAASYDAWSLQWLAHPWLGWLGERSFGIYVWHYIILGYLREGLGRSWPVVALYFGLTLLAAHFSYGLFEAPMRRAIRNLAAAHTTKESVLM